MPSKFGGVPVENEQPRGGSKFGGIPVEADSSPTAGLPPAPSPAKGNAVEEFISPTGGPDNFWTSPHGLVRTGLRGIAQGVRRILTPGERTAGMADMIEGAGTAALPAAIPLAVANPIPALVGAATGMTGYGVGRGLARVAGASPGTERLVGDVAGIGTGGVSGKAAAKVGGLVRQTIGNRAGQDTLLEMIPYWGSKLAKLRGLANPTPQAPEPFRANPNVAARMRYGGSAETEVSAASRSIAPRMRPSERGVAPSTMETPEVAPQAPEPFKPNPNVARRMKFGGPAEPEYGTTGSRPIASGGGPKPMPGAPGVKRYEIQHYGDKDLPRNQVAGPEMFNAQGQRINPATGERIFKRGK